MPADAPWPQACACGYIFTDADPRQVNDQRYYARSAGPGIVPDPEAEKWPDVRELPAGAMVRMWWLEPHHAGPDGMSIGVVLPEPSSVLFPMDFPSSDGGRWTRSGAPPRVTLAPSINHVNFWHGWLRDGVLDT